MYPVTAKQGRWLHTITEFRHMAYSSGLRVQHQECYDTLVGQDRFSGVLVNRGRVTVSLFE